MKNSWSIIWVLVGIAILGWSTLVHAETVVNEPERRTDQPITVRIVEASSCAEAGIRLRVEIANNRKTPYRFSICTGRIVCCVENMFVVLTHGDTGIGLLDAQRAAGKQETGEVILVEGAVYSFPVTIPLERLPDDYQTPGLLLNVELGFLTDDDGPVHSEKAKVILAAANH